MKEHLLILVSMNAVNNISTYEEAIGSFTGQPSFDEIKSIYRFTWSNVMFLSQDQIKELIGKLVSYNHLHPQLNAWGNFATAYGGPAKGNNEETLSRIDSVIELFKEVNDDSGVGAAHCLKGMIHKTMGRLDLAQENLDVSLKYIEKDSIFEHFRKVTVYQIAELSLLTKDFNKAEKFFLLCRENTSPGDGLYGRALNGLGGLELNKSNYQNAIDIYSEALKECGPTKNIRLYTKTLTDLGICYIKLKKFKEAIKVLEESMLLRLEEKFYDGVITNYILLAEIYLVQNDLARAYEYALTGDRHAKDLNIIIKEVQCEKLLAEICEAMGDHQKALSHFKNYHSLDAQINGQESARKMEQMKSRHDMLNLEKEKEIFRLKNVELKSALDEINESIRYARHLQEAILPSGKFIAENLPDSFILYLPKDIVAGDFYWAAKKDHFIIIAAADCTGHGVPGALVSVVCSNALNRAVNEFHLTDPGKILDKVRECVIENFERSEHEVKDGMDISLCIIDKNSGNITWSGANNPLWIIRQNTGESADLQEILPDKQPVGKYIDHKPFTTHHLKVNKNDWIYCFTDGYADQFGGPKGKKLKYTQLKELLLANCKMDPEMKKDTLLNFFHEWKGDMEQVDDICIIGIRM